ncbi:hypothetical protein [Streptomyces sp. NPDC020983]|uniref:hypothetical protein n=1 Tax=Streptomyces sp. NPDC020983 TaxID=3365106 RepID=UPI0037BC5CDB
MSDTIEPPAAQPTPAAPAAESGSATERALGVPAAESASATESALGVPSEPEAFAAGPAPEAQPVSPPAAVAETPAAVAGAPAAVPVAGASAAVPGPVPPVAVLPPAPAYPPPAYPPGAQAVAAAPRRMGPRVRVRLRWTAVVLVFAVFGAATAYAVARPERTRIPGLRTPDDGRWTYPALALPQLPGSRPRPFDATGNPAAVHYADLRALLLPEPRGAVDDTALPGTKGWLPPATYLATRPDGDGPQQEAALKDGGLRHIAARGWTMPDGTRGQVYLLQFISRAYAGRYLQGQGSTPPKGVSAGEKDTAPGDLAHPEGTAVHAFGEKAPYGTEMTRYAAVGAGDTVAVVVLTRKGGAVPEQAFTQTVVLQAQMLG